MGRCSGLKGNVVHQELPGALEGRVDYRPDMWFGILGHLVVSRSDGTPVDVPGPARRQLLAALVSRAGAVVTTATLIDDLWGSAPPRSAVNSLRSHIARVRTALAAGGGGHLLVTQGDAYRLCIEPDDIDAGRFDALVRAADGTREAHAAVDLYDEALALWRDDPYVEFGDAPFAVLERVRLAELRAGARERRTDLALQIGAAGQLVAELEQRVRIEPYRERGWEQLALALYRAERQADALAACRRARAVLLDDLGVDPGPGLQSLEQRLLRQDADLIVAARPPAAQPAVDRCPYLGLRGYDDQDAALFVGRERLTSVLASRIADQSIVLVTGPSGVGKSSLVRAGLVPALRNGALPGSASWRVDVRTPSTVGRVTGGRRPDLVILDQAEELFTALDPDARDDVADHLLKYVRYGAGCVVLVLRSDFFARLSEVESLAPFAGKTAVSVGPMRTDELRRALVEPAATSGVRLEDELIETVLDDVAGQPEPLPLLSEAMVRTWSRRDGDLLTLAGYRRSGEVAGALEAAAEECYARLGEDARRSARHLLVRMAAPSGGGGWVRRPLVGTSVPIAGPERATLDAFVTARLAIVADQRVDLAHDALLERWPRLRSWLDERMLAADLVEHLEHAATAWRASGEQDADLYRGARLSAALDWRAEHPEDVSPEAGAFIDASNEASRAELAAARAQVAREVHGRRRLRRVVVALAAVAVVAAAGGAIALLERSTAQSQTGRAERNALTADVSRLAALAGSLPGDQRDVALLLGAQAYRLEPSDATAGGLQTALMRTPPGLHRLIRYPSSSQFPHLDRSGRLLAAPGADGSVTIYDVATGQRVRRLHWRTSRQFAVFSADDRFVAAGGSDGDVVVWNVATGRPAGSPLHVRDGAVHPIFDPRRNSRLYVLSTHGGLTEWDRTDPGRPRKVRTLPGLETFSTPGEAPDLTISPDGQLIAAGQLQLTYTTGERFWDTRTGAVLRDFGGAVGDIAEDGFTAALGFGNDTVLLNARTGRIESTFRGTGGSALALLSPDGRRLAVPEQYGTSSAVTVYDAASHRRVGQPLTVGSSVVYPLGFLSRNRLVTTGQYGAAVWSIGASMPPLGVALDTAQDRGVGSSVARSGDGSEYSVFLPKVRDVITFGNQAVLHDPASGRPVGQLLGGAAWGPIAGSPDGRLVVASGSDSRMQIWDRSSARPLSTLRLDGAALAASRRGRGGLGADSVYSLQWSPEGRRIAAAVGGVPYIWDVTDPRHPSAPVQIRGGRGGVLDDFAFTPDGRRLLMIWAGPRISLVDPELGRTLWTRPVKDATELNQFAISPDGTSLVYDTGDSNAGEVTLLDLGSGRLLRSIGVPTTGGVGFLNHGQWVVVTSDDPAPQAQLYGATTLTPLGVPFPMDDVNRNPVVVDPEGTRFADEMDDGYGVPQRWDPRLWTADPATWVRIACTIAGRNLTHAEWKQYLPDRPYQRTCSRWP